MGTCIFHFPVCIHSMNALLCFPSIVYMVSLAVLCWFPTAKYAAYRHVNISVLRIIGRCEGFDILSCLLIIASTRMIKTYRPRVPRTVTLACRKRLSAGRISFVQLSWPSAEPMTHLVRGLQRFFLVRCGVHVSAPTLSDRLDRPAAGSAQYVYR